MEKKKPHWSMRRSPVAARAAVRTKAFLAIWWPILLWACCFGVALTLVLSLSGCPERKAALNPAADRVENDCVANLHYFYEPAADLCYATCYIRIDATTGHLALTRVPCEPVDRIMRENGGRP